jgi:hypothetical protein
LLDALFKDNFGDHIATSVSELSVQVKFAFVSNLTTCHRKDLAAAEFLLNQGNIGKEARSECLLNHACIRQLHPHHLEPLTIEITHL